MKFLSQRYPEALKKSLFYDMNILWFFLDSDHYNYSKILCLS